MATPPNVTESEISTWIVRVGMFVVAFFLALGVKDAKKSLDKIPELVATVDALVKSQEALFRRVEKLEEERRR
jgi:cell division protein FtsB